MKKRLLALSLVVLMLFSLTACGEKAMTPTDAQTTAEETTEEVTQVKYDTVFGDFSSYDVDGNEVTAEIFKGKKVTMVNIWATYCSPCISEMPGLERLSKDYADKDFQIVGIACDVYSEDVLLQAREVIEYTGVTYLNIVPSLSLDQAKLNSVYSVPETVFVDENGVQIGRSYSGSRDYEQWAQIIDSVLASVE